MPPYLRPDAVAEDIAEEVPADPLADLLKENTREIVGSFVAMTTDELRRLEQMELAGQSRKGVLAAIAETVLARTSSGDDPVQS